MGITQYERGTRALNESERFYANGPSCRSKAAHRALNRSTAALQYAASHPTVMCIAQAGSFGDCHMALISTTAIYNSTRRM